MSSTLRRLGIIITLSGVKLQSPSVCGSERPRLISNTGTPTRVMIPSRCSIKQDGRQCPNPPEFIVTITRKSSDGIGIDGNGKGRNDEYMIAVTCARHKQIVVTKIRKIQRECGIGIGEIGFTPVKQVGTDCIRGDPDELVQIGTSPNSATAAITEAGRRQ